MGYSREKFGIEFPTDILEQLLDVFWKIVGGVLTALITKTIIKHLQKIEIGANLI